MAPRGAKRGSRRGNFQGASRGNRQGFGGFGSPSFDPYGGYGGQSQHAAWTLAEEARNTERHNSPWAPRLRDKAVNFVSAGTLEPQDSEGDKDAEEAMADMTLNPPAEDYEIEVEVEEEEEPLPESKAPTISPSPVIGDQPPLFVVDTLGSQPVATGLPPPEIRPSSPIPSDSSEEIILYRGRGRQPKVLPPKPAKVPQATTIDDKIKDVEEMIHERQELLKEVRHQSREPERKTIVEPSNPSTDFEAPKNSRKRGSGKARKNERATQKQEEEDAILADYIANMKNESDDESPYDSQFRPRDLDGDENDIVVEEEEDEVSAEEPIPDSGTSPAEWDASDIREFDDLSTSDGGIGDVQTIISKRERDSGVTYLVVYENQTMDEARWVRQATLTGFRALAMLEAFDAEEKLLGDIMKDAEESSDSEDDSDDDDDDDQRDKEDLLQRKIDRMSDEKIARLLAKQEELGMGSSELLLFDDEADDDKEGNFVGFSQLSRRDRKKKIRGPDPARGVFPNATALAEAYDGFDVMDFERPSLQKKPKGRKGKLVIDNSDSELEASMQKAWDNDRVKKKERKQEREELRAQGLLGSKNGKVDMKAKHKEGMAIHEVKEAMKSFLMGTDATLPLTPMDKANRKIVHELANAFNLKSKSVGNGDLRFPVLYRTKRTNLYSESKFSAVEAKLTRRFFPRMDVSNKKGPRPVRGGGGGFGGTSAAGYRDGDIVGASAPELGVENKGRAMLEKMGWSTGTALGAINNKGILQPVSHVVKTTKAGLG